MDMDPRLGSPLRDDQVSAHQIISVTNILDDAFLDRSIILVLLGPSTRNLQEKLRA